MICIAPVVLPLKLAQECLLVLHRYIITQYYIMISYIIYKHLQFLPLLGPLEFPQLVPLCLQ